MFGEKTKRDRWERDMRKRRKKERWEGRERERERDWEVGWFSARGLTPGKGEGAQVAEKKGHILQARLEGV